MSYQATIRLSDTEKAAADKLAAKKGINSTELWRRLLADAEQDDQSADMVLILRAMQMSLKTLAAQSANLAANNTSNDQIMLTLQTIQTTMSLFRQMAIDASYSRIALGILLENAPGQLREGKDGPIQEKFKTIWAKRKAEKGWQ